MCNCNSNHDRRVLAPDELYLCRLPSWRVGVVLSWHKIWDVNELQKYMGLNWVIFIFPVATTFPIILSFYWALLLKMRTSSKHFMISTLNWYHFIWMISEKQNHPQALRWRAQTPPNTAWNQCASDVLEWVCKARQSKVCWDNWGDSFCGDGLSALARPGK